MKGLRGKNALVTGGSSGIGQAIAIRLAQEGANVAIHYNRNDEGARVTQSRIDACADVKTLTVQADLAAGSDIDRMFGTVLAELNGVDLLINNAGYQICGPSHAIAPDDFARVIATNLTGAFPLRPACDQPSVVGPAARSHREHIERA